MILTTDKDNVNERCQFRTNAGAANATVILKAARDRLPSYSLQIQARSRV